MWRRKKAGPACASCGERHSGLSLVFGADAPLAWQNATDDDRAAGALDKDLCVVTFDGRGHNFIRGHLEIPVTDGDGTPFTWSVWVSLSDANMNLLAENWENPARTELEPMFGWLNSALTPYDPSTLALATHVHQRPVGRVPFIELDPALDHPLVREQLDGITMHRVAELNAQLLGH